MIKNSIKLLSFALLFTHLLQAEENVEIATTSGRKADPVRTFIPNSLTIPAFTPPAPAVEKKVPAMRVDSAITLQSENSRTLTLIRGEASTLPDIPILPEPEPQQSRPLITEDPASIANQRRHNIQLGATIYDHRVSQVHWQHPDTGESYEAICGFDLSLLEGLGQFVHDGEIYQIMLTLSPIDTSLIRRTDNLPDLSAVQSNFITIRQGNPKDLIGTAPVTLLKELIISQKSRLITYQADRKRYQQAAAEWEQAHPPVPRDETIWLRPHRGSRYLADPTPEAVVK